MIQTTSSSALPVTILDTNHTIQPPITGSLSEVSTDRLTSDLLKISWDFGLVSNPSNSSGGLLRLLYTAVINEMNEIDTPLSLSASSFASGLMVSTTQLNVVTVTPLLVISDFVSVSAIGFVV